MEGIGMYWTIVEILGEKVEKRSEEEMSSDHCQATFDAAYLANILRMKPKRLTNVLGTFAEHSLLSFERSEDVIRIKMPKLLESMDRDSKKARQKPDTGAPRARLDVDVDKEKDIINTRPKKPRIKKTKVLCQFGTAEDLWSAVHAETRLAWEKLYPDDLYRSRELIKAFEWHKLHRPPTTISGWTQFLANWLENGWARHQANAHVGYKKPNVIEWSKL